MVCRRCFVCHNLAVKMKIPQMCNVDCTHPRDLILISEVTFLCNLVRWRLLIFSSVVSCGHFHCLSISQLLEMIRSQKKHLLFNYYLCSIVVLYYDYSFCVFIGFHTICFVISSIVVVGANAIDGIRFNGYYFIGCPVLCSRFRVRFSNVTNIIPNCFYLRKVRISAKIFHGIDKMTIFAEENCGFPQKSFVDYGYREK